MTTGQLRNRTRNAVLLVDIENLIGGGARPQPLDIVQFVRSIREHFSESISEFAIARAYANWTEGYLRSVRGNLHKADIDPVQIFRFVGRVDNAADAEMIVDAISIAYERPELETFVVASADGAFAPVVTKLHELGRTVVGVCSTASELSPYMLEVCDLFARYDNKAGTLEAIQSEGPSLLAEAGQQEDAVSVFSRDDLIATLIAIVDEALVSLPIDSDSGVVLNLSGLTKYFNARLGTGWKSAAERAKLVDASGEPMRLSVVLRQLATAAEVNGNVLVIPPGCGRTWRVNRDYELPAGKGLMNSEPVVDASALVTSESEVADGDA
jgi:hypothetical protein